MKTWNETLKDMLIRHYGDKEGSQLFNQYSKAFPMSYMDEYSQKNALEDIVYLEQTSETVPLQMHLYTPPAAKDNILHLRLFQWQKPAPLSDILPMLENFDLRTENERPHRITTPRGIVWISDFSLVYAHGTVEIERVRDLFQDAFSRVYLGHLENDGFNKLVLGAALSGAEIIILRALTRFLLQTGFRFSQMYIEKALVHNSDLSRDLVNLFKIRHDPKQKNRDEAYQTQENIIRAKLEKVSSLDEDLIIQRFLNLIKATLRCNYYQQNFAKSDSYFALKMASERIIDLPLPHPMFEIFVYSSQFEGIHLRKDKIARGGLRWSERPEDYRTEVLGLMKAQTVKNSVIVPSGAKGGFVLKNIPQNKPLKDVVSHCYSLFIHALLDLTDNIQNGRILPPPEVVCHDKPDPYLVVAADKGTATFSDLANSVSEKHAFWLGDAFASGGSAGYDHKKMGITAKGAFESVKRHFYELGKDLSRETITVAGIGDMSGDVFGNGLLYSNRLKLIAAFDHRHIFIDPTPNALQSFEERQRLFNLPASSWQDYNPALISKGGGVFSRSLKSITLSPEMQKCLGTEQMALSPNDLIAAVLKAPVDLLFNGGVGTYVKASHERNFEVGDRTNDYCRVNGNELRCKVVGEGGNLGFTQAGRIEFALNNGLINTDFIDNSAGVDCSDHEVNLKILLNTASKKNDLEKRNQLLSSMTREISDLVLKDNRDQALTMSYSAFSARKNIDLHAEYLNELCKSGLLNRKVEGLPDDKTLIERRSISQGLTRPELAVMLAYTKISIKNCILKSDLTEDAFLSRVIASMFPPSLGEEYHKSLQNHPLRKEIMATKLANDVVNHMGITFIFRMQRETGASVADIIRAYTIASQSFDILKLHETIESLDFKIPMQDQFTILHHLRKLINLATRWFLRGRRMEGDMQKIISHYRGHIQKLEPSFPKLISGLIKEYLDRLTDKFLKADLSEALATKIVTRRALYTALNIIEVATEQHFDLEKTAKIYFVAGQRMNLVWFRDQIASDAREEHWHALTRLTLRDELDDLQSLLTTIIIRSHPKETDTQTVIQNWMTQHSQEVEKWENFLVGLYNHPALDYSMFFIAIRELRSFLVR